MKKIIKQLASLKLAIFVILALAAISAVGTFYESSTNEAYAAQKVVFKSPYMIFVQILLIINLTAVMVDRWPWKVKHTGFVCAHIGIIVLIFGSWLTYEYGIDGSMSIEVGGKSRSIMLPDRQLTVYAYDENLRPKELGRRETDFIIDQPEEDEPLFVVADKPITLKKYYHFAERDDKIVESDNKNDGAAIRFLLSNDRVSVSEWMMISKAKKDHVVNLGPARVIWDYDNYKYDKGNVLHLSPNGDKIKYKIYSQKKGGLSKEGETTAGTIIQTGWMGLELRLFNYYKHATRKTTYQEKKSKSDVTQSAILINFEGRDHWLGLNTVIRLYTDKGGFILSYGSKQVQLPYNVFLKKFNVGRYQGTMRAATYASDVFIDGLGDYHISMNEPLKYKGLTFYQASFGEGDDGKPTNSVLSVNQDPGREIKYLGCIIMVFGICHLFYYKRFVQGRRKKKVSHV